MIRDDFNLILMIDIINYGYMDRMKVPAKFAKFGYKSEEAWYVGDREGEMVGWSGLSPDGEYLSASGRVQS